MYCMCLLIIIKLDGPNAGQVVREDEPDFYAAANK